MHTEDVLCLSFPVLTVETAYGQLRSLNLNFNSVSSWHLSSVFTLTWPVFERKSLSEILFSTTGSMATELKMTMQQSVLTA